MIKRTTSECVSCKDPIRERVTPDSEQKIDELLKNHCYACALELATGEFRISPTTTMHGTGGGHRVIHSTKPFS